MESQVNSLTKKINDIKDSKIFQNSFEWRFEFPEVLNDDGDFVGFDVVIGNPPYGIKPNDGEKDYFKNEFLKVNCISHIMHLYKVIRLFTIFRFVIHKNFQVKNKDINMLCPSCSSDNCQRLAVIFSKDIMLGTSGINASGIQRKLTLKMSCFF